MRYYRVKVNSKKKDYKINIVLKKLSLWNE